MDDADAALLGQGDGQGRLGHRVHGRRENRDVDFDASGQAGLQVRFTRNHITVGRKKENIVKGNGVGDNPLVHWLPRTPRKGR